MAKFELFMGCLGNGVTVCNKAVTEHGDYKKIAHISEDAINTYYRRRNRQKRAERRRQEKLYYIKQKIFGIIMATFGVLIPFIAGGDATISLFIIPMGLYMIFTKEKVLML